jgi:phosphoadenosine phosphosulfate reductase
VIAFVRRNGERAMYESIALRKACCGIRKLEPLARMLAGRSAWVTGLRREQSDTRAARSPFEPTTDDHGRVKLNPLADWSWADVWHYIASARRALQPAARPVHAQHRLRALHPRHRRGRALPRRPLVVGDEKAKECGLHVKAALPI